MILPTKHLPEDRTLLRIGVDIVSQLGEPQTVSRLWSLVKKKRSGRGSHDILTFDWFILSLDMLFALGLIDFSKGTLWRINS